MGDSMNPQQTAEPISAVLADIDGTLVTQDKVLTERAIQAVKPAARARDRVHGLQRPAAARPADAGRAARTDDADGGLQRRGDRAPRPVGARRARRSPTTSSPAIVEAIEAHGLDVWIYTATDWYVRSRQAPRVDREASTSQSEPNVVATFDGVLTGVVKIVGVSDDHARVAACEAELQHAFGTQVSAARSQPYYLDVTHPTANKGGVIERLARYLKIPVEAIATHRRPAHRRADVQAQRHEHRDGQCARGREAAGDPRDHLQ